MKFVYIFTWDPQSIDYSTVKRQFFGEGSPLGALLCQVSIMKRYEEQRSSGHNSRSSGCRDWAPIFRVMATKLCNKKDATILKSDMESKQTRSEHIRYQYMWSVNPGKSRMYSSFHHLQQQFFQTVIKSSSENIGILPSCLSSYNLNWGFIHQQNGDTETFCICRKNWGSGDTGDAYGSSCRAAIAGEPKGP